MNQKLVTVVHRLATDPELRAAFERDPEQVLASIAPDLSPGLTQRLRDILQSSGVMDESLGDWYGRKPPAEALFSGS